MSSNFTQFLEAIFSFPGAFTHLCVTFSTACLWLLRMKNRKKKKEKKDKKEIINKGDKKRERETVKWE